MAQFGQFDAAIIAFKQKYKYLPGDAPGFGGNGNGILQRWATSNAVDRFQGEIGNFWNNLDSTQFPKQYAANIPALMNISGVDKNMPEAKIGKKNTVLASPMSQNNSTGVYADSISVRHYYVLLSASQQTSVNASGVSSFTSTTSTSSSTSTQEMAALDQKMDDSLADSGQVISGSMNGTVSKGLVLIPNSTCSIGSTYIMTTTTNACSPLIRMGAQAGNPL